MRANGWNYSSDFAEDPSRDSIDGLAAIALALDDGLGSSERSGGSMLLDGIAILLGWAVLIAVILYPALQLAVIGACATFMLGRALLFPRPPRPIRRASLTA